jgi:hypothetical protein
MRNQTDGAALVAAFQASGLSKRAFCRERDISKSCLYFWLSRRRTQAKLDAPKPACTGFVPIELADWSPDAGAPLSRHEALRVQAGRVTLTFSSLPSAAVLGAMLAQLDR